jgi:hypothetical protein
VQNCGNRAAAGDRNRFVYQKVAGAALDAGGLPMGP